MTAQVAVLGGGAWGTAIAIHLATRTHARPRVTLYVRNAAQARACVVERENRRYLPNVALPPALAITPELREVRADVLFAAAPVAELDALRRALEAARIRAPLVSLAKGFVGGP